MPGFMNNQKIILKKLERQLTKITTLLAKTEPQADLAFCEKGAKTLTIIIKALEAIRNMQMSIESKINIRSDTDLIVETDHDFRDEITQRLAAINQQTD